MANNTVRTGGILAGAGCLFGLAPLIISLLAAAMGSGIGNVLHWYTFFTAPVGLVVFIVGIVMAIVAASKRTPSELAAAASIQGETAASSAESQPVALPPVPTRIASKIRLFYLVLAIILTCSAAITLGFGLGLGGVMIPFELVPPAFAWWLWRIARNAEDGGQFLRLHNMQRIMAIAGCVTGIYPLFYAPITLELLSDADVDAALLMTQTITGLLPLAASIASLFFGQWALRNYRRQGGNS